ncbi:MAG: hypothetical protein IJ235_04915 [Eubacterium sp.]|nr:hypothetical protein [Eubacterium sp.]MBQ8981519.1 hypothetical protein [Eubacterium sp.]
MNNQSHIELEKKFLIEYPDLQAIAKYNPIKYEIEQIYLVSEVGSHRIRKRSHFGIPTYFETLKVRITESKCHEYEDVITEPEYEQLKLSADPKKHPINKDRYVFSYGGKVLEVDVFPFWNDKAFLEIELDSEDDNYSIPPEIHIIKDVSDDPEYKNRKLANNK